MKLDAAQGLIANAKATFATSLANCTAWRTFDGASLSVAQALARIYFDALPPPPSNAEAYTAAQLEALRPLIIVYRPKAGSVQLEFEAVAATASGARHFLSGGVLEARIERTFPAAQLNDPGNADRQFENALGLMLTAGDTGGTGLAELAGVAGFSPITKMMIGGPWRVDPNNDDGFGDYQVSLIRVEWGWLR